MRYNRRIYERMFNSLLSTQEKENYVKTYKDENILSSLSRYSNNILYYLSTITKVKWKI